MQTHGITIRATSVALVLTLAGGCLFAMNGCSDPAAAWQVFGEPVDPSKAENLADLLKAFEPDEEGVSVVVAGRIGEVCRSAGCWFVLQEVQEDRVYQLFTDLKAGAAFTVPADISGRPAVVRGRIVGEKPDLKLNAVGLIVQHRGGE